MCKSIIYHGEEPLYESIEIAGEIFKLHDEFRIPIPKKVLEDVKVIDMHPLIELEVCERVEDDIIYSLGVPFIIRKEMVNGKYIIEVRFEEILRRKFWNESYGLQLYMETKKTIIQERSNELQDITLLEYEDDGDYVSLQYKSTYDCEYLKDVIRFAEEMILEIEGAIELSIKTPFNKRDKLKNEADFTLSLVIPLLRRLRFRNVKYNHGKREYGKDITFCRNTEFGETEYFAVQVKFGNVSGGSKSDIDDILSQAQMAFTMPFYDVYSRRKQRISKLVIIISGKFTENATERIIEGIESNAIKNNMIFIDGDKINDLIEQSYC